MTLTITKKALVKALDHASNVAGSYTFDQLRGAVSLKVQNGALRLSIPGDMPTILTLPCEVGLSGEGKELILPAPLLSQLVKNAPSELIHLEFESVNLSIRSGGSDNQIQGRDPTGFALPAAPSPSEGFSFALPAAELIEGLDGVLYAASHEAFQAVFRGVKWEGRGDSLRFVASDGYRVAIADLPHVPPQTFAAVIGAAHLRDLLRLLKDEKESVSLQITDSHVTVRSDTAQIMLPKMAGDFPDYERILPKVCTNRVVVSAAALRESIGRVAILADRNANNRTELTVQPDRLDVFAEGDYGRATDTVTASATGDPLQVAVNARILMDALDHASGQATLEFNGALNPVVVTSERTGLKHVFVTLRV